MYVDISKPPPPLPAPHCTEVLPGVSLLQPLSRRGNGPGMILVVPDSSISNLSILDGVPSPLIKWAEESYTVIEIQERALSSSRDVLQQAIRAVLESEKCAPKDTLGLVVYGGKLWNSVAPMLASVAQIAGAVVFAEASEIISPAPSSVPCLKHLVGEQVSLSSTGTERVYAYPSAQSDTFGLPFQETFSYSLEALSHTRNLQFFKKLMNGPYFDLEHIWEEHTYFEFENRSVEWTMSTMVQEPYVNHIPTLTGGVGREQLTDFYKNHFIFSNPSDVELEVISRTIGVDRVVDEFIYKMTHDREVDWLVPGVPPTGKKLEIPMTAIVNIRGDRLYHEHISWDQGTVLAQIGLIPDHVSLQLQDSEVSDSGRKIDVKLPIAGVASAAKMRDRKAVESNGLIQNGN